MKKLLNRLILVVSLLAFALPMNGTAQTGMKFDNIDDYIAVPNASALIAGSSTISLSFWVYPENTAAGFPNFDGFAGFRNNSNADFYLLQLSSTNVEARFRNSTGTNYDIVFTGLNLNQWNHFVFTYDGTAITLYHDGANVGSTPASGTITNTAQALELGRTFFLSPSFYLNGKLDNVALWGSTLSQGEVTTLYNGICEHDLSDPNLLLCYEFTEGTINGNNTSVPSLFDGKGNINGVFNGLALTGATSNYALGVTPSVTTSTIDTSTCTSYISPVGNTYSTPGVYVDTLNNVYGCDSLITINLTNLEYQVTIAESFCSSYTSPAGNIYTSSGTYMDTLSSAQGCDSIITINLTETIFQTNIAETVCESYTVPSGNATYTTSGVYSDTLTSVGGCDSIITINLTIGTYQTTISETACDAYTVPSGNATYTTSGVYNDTLNTVLGCDSVLLINLTIANSESSISETACNSYTVPSGNATYTTTGVYTDTLTNSLGCDSVITITLTINSVDNGVTLTGETLTSSDASASYQWINCATNTPIVGANSQSYTPLISGEYAVIVTNMNCSDTSACTQVTVSSNSLDEVVLNSISTFPNPVSDLLTITFDAEVEQFDLSISNLAGQEIVQKEFKNVDNAHLSMANFDDGLYFVLIKVGNSSRLIKVVKQ